MEYGGKEKQQDETKISGLRNGANSSAKNWKESLGEVVIAYGEWCWIRDLQKRFSFGTRDQPWSLKSFCVAKFY